jgi:nitronate monooxygenase
MTEPPMSRRRTVLDQLSIPIVQAPMAGGPSTPALAAAVSEAGGLGFVAAGYKTADGLVEDMEATRALTRRPFGVNVFSPAPGPADPRTVQAYVTRLEPEATAAGVALGVARHDDDHYAAKLERLLADPPAVVSFTFGCPERDTVDRLHDAGISVWVTVTDPAEAERAAAVGADAVAVQGCEAGGHRGSFTDLPDRTDYGVLALLQLVRARVDVPLVAGGGVATGAGVAAVLAAGAAAAQVGTAFLRCPEAGTSAAHRRAVATSRPTALTRAFSGRLARGIVNRWLSEHSAAAPIAYPEIHHVTAPLRAHARQAGDEDVINLWAGEAHELARDLPAAEVVRRLADDAREALAQAQAAFSTRASAPPPPPAT